MQNTILRAIDESIGKATTVNRIFKQLTGSHKATINHAMDQLIADKKVLKTVAMGETARMLNVLPGTVIYILNNESGVKLT